MRRRELLLIAAATMGMRAARAQQKAMPVVGYLSSGSPGPALPIFRQGLAETGYVEGQNVTLQCRWAEGHYDRLPQLAADLVERKVDVIAATNASAAALAAKRATTTIPVVFWVGVDPVASGLVDSLSRPGGNLTGFTVLARELVPKQIELISELAPQAKAIALLVNPTNPGVTWRDEMPRDLREAASARRVELYRLTASTESEIEAAFATLVRVQAGALLVNADPFFYLRRAQITMLATRHAVPAIYDSRTFTEIGGLISYGSNTRTLSRQVGIYVGRILAGTKPADLPVQQSTTFELVVNLKTAKELGVTIPPSILARADEVIE